MTEKPSTVVRAVKLLWAALLVGPLKLAVDFSFVDFSFLETTGPLNFLVSVLLVVTAVLAFLISKISAGRNWARITFLVIFILGFVPGLSLVGAEFDRSVLVGILSIAQTALSLYALFLIFTQPGSAWFRKV